MQTRTLGPRDLEVSAIGLGCMGMSQSTARRRTRSTMISLIRAAVDRGVTLLRHRRGLWPVHQRGARRRGARARSATRWSSPPSSACASIRPAARSGRRSTAARSTSARSPRRRCAGCGSTPSTCSTSTGSTQTCRSRTSPARCRDLIAAGQGPALRPVRGGRADHPPRARGAAGDGRPERVLAVVAAPGDATCCRPSRSSASGSCRSARWARASSPAASATRPRSTPRTSARSSRASSPRP